MNFSKQNKDIIDKEFAKMLNMFTEKDLIDLLKDKTPLNLKIQWLKDYQSTNKTVTPIL